MRPLVSTLFGVGAQVAFSDEQPRDYDVVKAAMFDHMGLSTEKYQWKF